MELRGILIVKVFTFTWLRSLVLARDYSLSFMAQKKTISRLRRPKIPLLITITKEAIRKYLKKNAKLNLNLIIKILKTIELDAVFTISKVEMLSIPNAKNVPVKKEAFAFRNVNAQINAK